MNNTATCCQTTASGQLLSLFMLLSGVARAVYGACLRLFVPCATWLFS